MSVYWWNIECNFTLHMQFHFRPKRLFLPLIWVLLVPESCFRKPCIQPVPEVTSTNCALWIPRSPCSWGIPWLLWAQKAELDFIQAAPPRNCGLASKSSYVFNHRSLTLLLLLSSRSLCLLLKSPRLLENSLLFSLRVGLFPLCFRHPHSFYLQCSFFSRLCSTCASAWCEMSHSSQEGLGI